MPILPPADLRAIHALAVEARLSDSREALLFGLPEPFRRSLADAADPASQLLRDLDALAVATLEDGSPPLRVWLENAAHLTRGQAVSAVFARYRDALPPAETLHAAQRSHRSIPTAPQPSSPVGPPGPAAPPSAAPLTRDQLLDALARMLPAQFEQLLDRLEAPVGDLAGPMAGQKMRAVDLLRWADQAGALAEVHAAHAEISARRARRP